VILDLVSIRALPFADALLTFAALAVFLVGDARLRRAEVGHVGARP
jgi:hypothetical protein